jgi:gliding motility-associated-like protein
VKRLAWTFLFTLCSLTSWAQIDTEFWFAPPEITSGHGDRPIYLRISTLDKAATVLVTQPARNNFVLANLNIAANSTGSIDLTSYILNLEPANPASVQKNGIKITSTASVTAYYEVAAQFNTDIFALKGKNALGNKFVIAGQNLYHNTAAYTPTPYFSFDIVATRNNTVIKIKPTRVLAGHGTAEFTVKLNAGETYSLRKNSVSANENPLGTIVESNKPIAITIKDDSVNFMSCSDMLGDQLVPVEVAGTEYVVIKGFLFGQWEYAFITATENDTQVHVSTGLQQDFTMQAGQVVQVPMSEPSSYIRSSKAVYVAHVTGFGCELGMAILPAINCRGSLQIGFSRTTTEFFGLNILVRKEGIGSFTLNNSASLVQSTSFRAVPGTNDVWYAAQLSFTTAQVPVNAASLISNSSHSFQVGLINGNETSSCRYGYFSAFSTLFIGDDFNMCEGETAILDAGPNKDSYVWSTGATTPTIDVTEPGKYWVSTESQSCTLADTIQIGVKKGYIDLGADITICEEIEAVADGQENFSWLWSTGSTDRYLKTTQPGKYWVSVFDYVGCQASDTIFISTTPKPIVNLGADVLKCPENTVMFDPTQSGASYLWDNGSAEASRTIQNAGKFWCQITRNGCSSRDTVAIENFPGPPQSEITGSETVCPSVSGVTYTVENISGSTYDWFVQGGVKANEAGSSLAVNWGTANNNAQVKVFITDAQSCTKQLLFPVRVNTQLLPRLPAGPDTLCLNLSNNVQYSTSFTTGSTYDWHITGGVINTGQGGSNIQVDWSLGINTLWVTETSVTPETVCSGGSEPLSVFVYDDPTSVLLKSATVNPDNESQIDVHWLVDHTEQINDDGLMLQKTFEGSTDWISQNIPVAESSYSDVPNIPDEQKYRYFISFTSACNQVRASAVHSLVQLLGEPDNEKAQLKLSWSPYQGWPNGVDRYEILARLDGQTDFQTVAIMPGNETQAKLSSITAFNHQYRIRALERDGSNESLSNSIELSFEHEVFVPNVITPNGDAFNQFFTVRNIHLFPENHLQIVDRWGKKVFESHGYLNTWEAKGEESGVYYFELTLARGNQVIRGTISVVR